MATEKSFKIFIIFTAIILVGACLWISLRINSIINRPAYNETYAYEDMYLIPKNIQINFSFLLQPLSQQTPRIFTNGEWELLPVSQSNILMNDSLTVCGRGGLYVYNMTSGNTDYIYRQDWYPCYNIYYLNKSSIAVEYLLGDKIVNDRQTYIGERVVFDIFKKNIVSNETIPDNEVMERYKNYFDSHVDIRNFELCNQDNSTCAKLNHSYIIRYGDSGGVISILYGNGSVQITNINNSIDLVGFKNDILFYAVDCSYGFSVLDHCLYAYDISNNISEKLLFADKP